jgi:hypothetical protein
MKIDMRMKITNDFHGTEAIVRLWSGSIIRAAEARRAKIALCGVDGCTCSGRLGERGPQPPIDSQDPEIHHGFFERWDDTVLVETWRDGTGKQGEAQSLWFRTIAARPHLADAQAVDIFFAGFIAGRRAERRKAAKVSAARAAAFLGSQTSERKAEAARANGTKGGRPRREMPTEDPKQSERPNGGVRFAIA